MTHWPTVLTGATCDGVETVSAGHGKERRRPRLLRILASPPTRRTRRLALARRRGDESATPRLDECYAIPSRDRRPTRAGPPRPGDVNELLDDFPLERYIVGILYPRTDDPVDPSQDDEPREGEDKDSLPDPPVAMASARYPSSAGLTFAVDIQRRDRAIE